MQVRVLGCAGSIAAGNRTTSFLLDADVLIDAGTGVGDLSLEELVAVDHIFVTHAHLDHVLSIGLLADTVTRRRAAAGRPPVRVYGLPATLKALREHIFNGVIWPDFTRLPEPERPVLSLHEIVVGQVLDIGGRAIEVLPARHTVPAVGYAIHGFCEAGAWVFTGDTGPNPPLWARLRQVPVGMLVIETAFGDEDAELAHVSQHLHPAALRGELAQLAVPTDVYITHVKPGEGDAVLGEIAAQTTPHRIHALASGQVMKGAVPAARWAHA